MSLITQIKWECSVQVKVKVGEAWTNPDPLGHALPKEYANSKGLWWKMCIRENHTQPPFTQRNHLQWLLWVGRAPVGDLILVGAHQEALISRSRGSNNRRGLTYELLGWLEIIVEFSKTERLKVGSIFIARRSQQACNFERLTRPCPGVAALLRLLALNDECTRSRNIKIHF